MIKRPSDIISRQREWDTLAAFAAQRKAGFALVIGRRRSGKSYLLTRLAESAHGVYYQATRQPEREQLASLSAVLAEHFADATLGINPLVNWGQLLSYLGNRARTDAKSLLLVLDEFTYLTDASPALPSQLQRWFDHELRDSSLRLVLCGSHVTAMRQLVDADQPLYGRRELRLEIRPFDYREAATFVPDWSPADRMRAYAIYGGLPGNLSLIDSNGSLAENVAADVLEETGRLYDEAAHVFDAYQNDAAVHYGILEAIAEGNRKWSRISSRVGRQASALQRPLAWLIDTAVVERTAPLSVSGKVNPKQVEYRIADPYLEFWYRFVAGLRRRGLPSLRSGERLFRAYVEERLDRDQVAHVFEQACRTYVARYGHDALGFDPVQVGRWWNADASVELDVVAVDEGGALLVGECKWGGLDRHDVDWLKQRASVVAGKLAGGSGTAKLVLFGGGAAVKSESSASVEGLRMIDLDQLYK